MALLLAVVLPLAILAGCSSAPPAPSPAVTVEAASARIEPISLVITAEGVLFPIHQASLAPKITAPVQTFYVQRGDRVHRGEPLAELDNRDLAAALVSAKGNYEQAKATYASTTSSTLPEQIQTATLNVKNTQTSLAAQKKLYASESKLYQQGAIARKQLNATEVALTAAQSAYQTAEKHLANLKATGESALRQQAKGLLETARGQYLAASAQLSCSKIRSPIDGVVTERTVFPGDIAPAGQPLIVVMDTSKVIARLHIPQSQAEQLKLGDRAELQEPGLARKIPGKVTVISPALDPNSTTVEIWVEANNPKGELQPGATITVSMTARNVPNALVVPAAAILTGTGGGKSVMVVSADGRAQTQAVQTGIEEGAVVQIVHGLQPGQEIIVNGAYGLPDGTKVKVTPASPGAGN